ncbi:hypothetical protein P3T76_000784 [Phytophthora citrophthora]|uniref:Uncharacterized protein n=1 Tax=Phytophthora citrophthora TaxID=4793 RepID=A0AAD9H1V8_9STRA|nr:hypothetical protein P3T76_000784 [Phytophthora citrophthora]
MDYVSFQGRSAMLPTLPLSVFSHVMEFAVFRYSQSNIPSPRSHPREYLKDVALVSKSWLQPVKQLMTQYEQETMEIHLKTGTLDDIIKVQEEVSTRGAAVRDLRVRIGVKSKHSYGDDDFLLRGKVSEQLQVDWSAILAKMSGLRRLDLKLVPLLSKHLPELLKAAGDHCAQLESLVLPRKPELKEVMQGEQIETVLKSLYATMEQVYVKGNRVGLKQLTVPTRNDAERHRSSTEFLDNVMKFCPNVEYLDGTDRACHSYDGVRCEDKWMVPLNTWVEFNRTCTKLREFQWTAVPFADPFFFAFSETAKPQLEQLTITANMLWSWKEYHRGCGDETTAAIKDCHGHLAKNVQVVLVDCPALKSLTIEIDLQKYSDSAVRHFNIDIYGDDLWASVAENCTLLERLAIRDCSNFEIMTVRPIETFTDESLLYLAELKNLYSLESNAAVMCTGDGIFEYMSQVLEMNYYTGAWRMLDLRIGGQENGDYGVPTFYSVVVDLLRCLSEISEEDFGAVRNKQKFEVFLSNPYHSRVSKQWSSKYMREELRPLMERVKEMHPSAMLNASVNGVSGDSFSKMDTFTMSWRPEDKDRDMFWKSEEDEYYTEDTPSDQLMPDQILNMLHDDTGDDRVPQELFNFFQEILGLNVPDEGNDSSDGDDDIDVEDNTEDNFWGF